MLISCLVRSTRDKLFCRVGLLNTQFFKCNAQRHATSVSRNKWECSDPSLPKQFNFFKDVIKHWAAKEVVNGQEGRLAFYHVHENGRETKWDFQELVHRTEKTAGVLNKCGLKRSDRIDIILPKVPEWWLIHLAAIQLGLLSSSGTTQLRTKDILHRLDSFQPQCIFANYETAERIDEVAKEKYTSTTRILCSEDGRERSGWLNFNKLYKEAEPYREIARTEIHDPMCIFFTSGTTGFPKMAQQSHSMAYNFRTYLDSWIHVKPGDIVWSMADTGWAKTAWSSLFYPWTFGACVFAYYYSSKFDAKAHAELLERYPINSICAPPTMYKMLLNVDLSKYNFGHISQCSSSGELLTEAVIRGWEKKTGLCIDSFYGQSESPMLFSTHASKIKKPGSLGLPNKNIYVSIIDEKGEEMAEGEEGDIGVKIKPYYPAGLFQEYLDNQKGTEKAFRGDYYITGDRGYRDKVGYFWFVGRRDDIISSAGYRIGPFEVENALQHHPAVLESAVVGVSDPARGEIVKAFVVLKEELRKVDEREMTNELQNHVKRVTAPYKYPREIEFVKELPKTASGKIQRAKLRARN